MEMKLVFLGPPGIGKGTHAEEVSKEFGIPKISTGDMIREEIKKGSKLGKEMQKYTDKGLLVPDETVIRMLRARIQLPDAKKGYILDGFPRTIRQAEELEKAEKITLVINMVADHKTIIARISNRVTCRKCGAIFNLLFVKPKKAGVCDECGGELYTREDQKPEVVADRLKVYERDTKPLIEFYRKKGLLVDLNCEGTKQEVEKKFNKLLEERFKK